MMNTTSLRQRTPALLLIGVAALFSIVPLASMISVALAPRGTFPQGLSWPTNPHWHNFVDAWTAANMWTLVKSGTLIVLGVVPVSILIATLAAYAVVILRIPFGGMFVGVLLVTLVLPSELVVVPLYYQVRAMGLPSNQLAFIIPAIGLNMPLAVFWMLTHFRGVPADLTEAARVDGANNWSAFRLIHLPLAVPHMAALSVLLFLGTWNAFLLPLVLIPDPNQRTMAGALQAFVT
jgi:raffinose/stachyose/melibiose transport system permease protein